MNGASATNRLPLGGWRETGNRPWAIAVSRVVLAFTRWMGCLLLGLALAACADQASEGASEAAASPMATAAGSAPGTSPPSVLNATCDGKSIALVDGLVSADPAGVHVRIENEADVGLYFQFVAGEGPWGGMKVPPGTTDLAIQLPPGRRRRGARTETAR
jgi:hypothetical protein